LADFRHFHRTATLSAIVSGNIDADSWEISPTSRITNFAVA